MADKKSDRPLTEKEAEKDGKTLATIELGIVGGGTALVVAAGEYATGAIAGGLVLASAVATSAITADAITAAETKDINEQSDMQVKIFEASASQRLANLKEMAGRADVHQELARRGATFNGKNNNDLILENPDNLKILRIVLDDKEIALRTAMNENESVLPREIQGVIGDSISRHEDARSDLAILHAARKELYGIEQGKYKPLAASPQTQHSDAMKKALAQVQDPDYQAPKKEGLSAPDPFPKVTGPATPTRSA